jgi:glutaredoxin
VDLKIIITGKNCSYCSEAKKRLKEKIKNGDIIEVDIDSPFGKKLDAKFDFDGVPMFLFGKVEKYELSEDCTELIFRNGSTKKI